MMEFPIIWKRVHWLYRKSIDWFLYDRDFRHERINLLNIVFNVFKVNNKDTSAFSNKWRHRAIVISVTSSQYLFW